MLKVNMNITRNTFIFCLVMTTLIAIAISYHRYNIGFRDEQIYYAIVMVYFVSMISVTPLLMTAMYCTTIDEERKKHIMNVLNIDDNLANKYIDELRYPTLSENMIKMLSGRDHILTKNEINNLNSEKQRFLLLLRIVKTSNNNRLSCSDYKDENIRKFIKENKKIYDFLT